ncbi:MAG: phosphatase PAP2 family protein [Coriobacteriia bacterium]|nr:phosphatase PAP2 family protein [Coriobacteriia bacterium]
MELTQYATWLNDVFALFDTFFLGLHHELAVSYGDIITPIANALGAAGHWGVAFIALAVILLFFRRTRMAGVAMLLALAISGALSEFVIKDIVMRPRPFQMSDTFMSWWQFVGSPDAHSYSFPSGHVAGATAAMIALAYAARKWWVSLLGVITVVAMAIDRMYLQVHYPSDVLAGFVLGFLAGVIGYAIIQGVWRLLGKHPDQIAARKYAASRHAEVVIPRGNEVQYAAVPVGAAAPQVMNQQPVAQPMGQQPQVTPAYAPSRYAQHANPQTLETAEGGTVVVPGVPVQQASADATQLIDMSEGTAGARPTSDSGFQMAEEYYRD